MTLNGNIDEISIGLEKMTCNDVENEDKCVEVDGVDEVDGVVQDFSKLNCDAEEEKRMRKEARRKEGEEKDKKKKEQKEEEKRKKKEARRKEGEEKDKNKKADVMNDSDDEIESCDEPKIKVEYFNLIKLTKDNTQLREIAKIFQNNIDKPLSSKMINTLYSTSVFFKDADLSVINNQEDLVNYIKETNKYLPGDVQRQLRTFVHKYKKYGIKCDNEYNKIKKKYTATPVYTWNPILKSSLDIILPDVARNIFKTSKRRGDFISQKNNTCEICCSKGKDIRMAIDHWRAHSIYNIDNENIAVLLCETCNNIHKNFDASKIFLDKKHKHIFDYRCFKNWIKLEKKIREKGYYPNEEDEKQQNYNILELQKYYTEDLENNETANKIGKEFSKLQKKL